MAKQRFGLGRGLDALISGASDVMNNQQQQQRPIQQGPETPLEVDIESITPNPRQPRRDLREDDPSLLELSNSIKEHGLIQPIIVVRLPQSSTSTSKPAAASDWLTSDGSDNSTSSGVKQPLYQIIAGERRWRASRMAGLTRVPVVIKDVNPQQMLEMALIENIQRSDLNPVEEALAYQSLIQEFNLTQEMVAKRVGKDRTTITNSLRLLQLSPAVLDMLVQRLEHFTEGHARALVGITNEADQINAMNQIIALRLNVRQAEELAARIKASEDVEKAVKSVTESNRSPELAELENNFRNALMVKVDLKCNAKGKGTVVLHFNSQEELEGLYNRLVKQEEEL